jgi:hypothetical protein
VRIHRIALRNYRGVTEAEVSLPSSGVTIIDGPNEVGKSSLLEAVQHLITYRDTSTHAAVRAVAPTHGHAVPEATVELSTGPYRFTYTKRWHRKHGTTSLTITEPQREQLQGREAHERVEQILDRTLDRPLWEALRLEQGAGLDGVGFAGAPSLSRALDLAAGGVSVNDPGDGLWDRIVAERDRYWYANAKPRAEGVELARSVADASAEEAAARTELAGLDLLTDEADALDRAVAALQHRVTTSARTVTELAARAESVATCRSQVHAASVARAAAAADEARLMGRSEQRTELMLRSKQSASAVAVAEQAQAVAAPRRAEVEAARVTAAEALTEARNLLAGAEAAHQLAAADRDQARQKIEVEQLTERRDGVIAARAISRHAREVLVTNQVTTAALAGVEEAQLEVVRAAAAAEVSATAIEATALAAVELMVNGEVVALNTEQRHELAVTGTTELVVPGVIRLMVRAGAEAGERAERLRLAEASLAAQFLVVGATDLDHARRRAAAHTDAAVALTDADAAIGRDLRDLTFEELNGKVGRLTERVAGYAARRPAQPNPPVDLSAAQAHAAATEKRWAQLRREVAERERAAQAADRASQEADVAAMAGVTGLDLARHTAEHDRSVLTAARTECTDDDLAKQAASAVAARAAADGVLHEATTTLGQLDPDRTDAALRRAQQDEAEARHVLAANRDRRQELRIVLDVRGEEGLADRIDRAATRHQDLVRRHDGWARRAEAARCLHEAVATRREETRRRYEAPLAERIETLGQLVFGPSLKVRLDANLAIAARTVGETTVAFDQLSTGAREQLGLLSRLACATLVDADDGVPVVLDDVLGWTDPDRLTEMGAALVEAGRHVQVIVLTCTPERFTSISGATAIHLGPDPVVEQRSPAAAPRSRRRAPAAPEAPTLFPVAERPAS